MANPKGKMRGIGRATHFAWPSLSCKQRPKEISVNNNWLDLVLRKSS